MERMPTNVFPAPGEARVRQPMPVAEAMAQADTTAGQPDATPALNRAADAARAQLPEADAPQPAADAAGDTRGRRERGRGRGRAPTRAPTLTGEAAEIVIKRDDDNTPVKDIPRDVALERLRTSMDGLTDEEAERRLGLFGQNMITEHKKNELLVFLGFFWNPLAWAMEGAAIISIVLLDYADFGLIIFLLTINATIGWYEDRTAGSAVAALKSQLENQSRVLRSGEFKSVPSAKLVPGDIIRVRIGDIIPADIKLIQGESVKIDQAALTGESLPVSKVAGDEAFAGSVVKQGEIEAVVHSTGARTFFGRAASLLEDVNKTGHLQSARRIMNKVGYVCLTSIFVWVLIELIVQFGVVNSKNRLGDNQAYPVGSQDPRAPNPYGTNYCYAGDNQCPVLNNIIVIIVGGIPIAMPTVLSVTLAIGALRLSKRNAIVSRLTAVEELAGMDVLCTDKTGTLTLNKLSIDRSAVVPMGRYTVNEVIQYAALSCRTDDQEPIDIAIINTLDEQQLDELHRFEVVHFIPFNPIEKRTIATLKTTDTGAIFHTCKGAPQVILRMAHDSDAVKDEVNRIIADYAARGYRALGVGKSYSGDVPLEERRWEMVGVLPLYDPPRADTAATIKAAMDLKIAVKMITGDQLAIAKETARQLGISTNIHTTEFLGKGRVNEAGRTLTAEQVVAESAGFAEVFPQHKFEIVKCLQGLGHKVGMTGDGVNDAPALKQSNIGIAVAGATDAARAAADIVLVTPGLSVIIDAIIGARMIFQRMKNYATYSVSMTIRITFTFGLLTCIYNWFFPPILILILAIFNDGTMLTISKDWVKPSPEPDHWSLKSLFALAFIFGLYLTGTTIILFAMASLDNSLWVQMGVFPLAVNTYEGQARLRGLIYLQVSISGQALIFVTRSRLFSWMDMPSPYVIAAFLVAQIGNTFIAVYGFNGYPSYDVAAIGVQPDVLIWGRDAFFGCGWAYAGLAWFWAAMWYIPLDFIKIAFMYLAISTRSVTSAMRVKYNPALPTTVASANGLAKGEPLPPPPAYPPPLPAVSPTPSQALAHP